MSKQKKNFEDMSSEPLASGEPIVYMTPSYLENVPEDQRIDMLDVLEKLSRAARKVRICGREKDLY